MAVKMSLGIGFDLGVRITLVGTGVAVARTSFGRPGLVVLPSAIRTNAAVDGVGAGGDNGPVVVGVGVRCARNGREERVRRIAVPAGGFAHFVHMGSPGTNGTDACVSVLVVTRGAGCVPEVRAIAGKCILNGVSAGEGVGKAGDVADVVSSPLADGVRFEDCSGVIHRMGLLANADLSIPLSYLHAAFSRASAAGYDAGTIDFVEGHFFATPVDDSISGGCLGQAVGLFVRKQWGCGGKE